MTTLRRNRIDLHTHTARSDGVVEPIELYEQMRAWGSSLVAITDHDTLAGVREILAAGLGRPGDGLRILAGVEINTAVDDEVLAVGGTEERLGELHILGLGVDLDDASLEAVLEHQRGGRARRFELTVERFRDLDLDIEPYLATNDGTVDSLGRPHIARALVAAGHAEDVNDAFSSYLIPGMPGYVKRQGIGPRAAIETIHASGGVASLAHSPWAPDEPQVMAELQRWGLRGLEAHYHYWDDERIERMAAFAERAGLLATGGSDYHGDHGSYAESQASVWVPEIVGERLIATLEHS